MSKEWKKCWRFWKTPSRTNKKFLGFSRFCFCLGVTQRKFEGAENYTLTDLSELGLEVASASKKFLVLEFSWQQKCAVFFRHTAARDFFISNEMQMNQMNSSQIFVLENQTLTVFDIALVAVDGANLNLMSCNCIWVHWFMFFRCPLWNYQFGRNLYQDFSDRCGSCWEAGRVETTHPRNTTEIQGKLQRWSWWHRSKWISSFPPQLHPNKR